MSEEYKYEKETIEIADILNNIDALQEKIDVFSQDLEMEDIDKLQQEIINLKETGEKSLNTKKDIMSYIDKLKEKEKAKKVAKLLSASNVLEYVSMSVANIDNSDIVAFQKYYNVRLQEEGYGTWRWLAVLNIDGKRLNAEDLYAYGIREKDGNSKEIAANVKSDDKIQEENPYEHYGWVSPNGEFILSDFGTHEESAIEIVKKHHWEKERRESDYDLCRDFLILVKGYALIHNPTGDGGYIVSNNHNKYTKAQREKLYDYFMYHEDRFMAKQFLNEEF